MEQLRAAGDGPQARKLLDTLFRQVHNLKARAAANGLTDLAAAAHEFENVLHALRKDSLQHALAAGARLFLLQTDFDVNDFERQFQSLKETLNQHGEVVSTVPRASKEHPGKVSFRIMYAATQPPELSGVTVEELPVDRPSSTNNFARTLEDAFHNFATELRTIPIDDVVAQAVRAGQAAAEATGKHVGFEVRGDPALVNPLIGDALLHLVRNAVDHGVETSGRVTIEIEQHNDDISITVSDDGRGIDSSLIDKIFEPGFSTAREVSTISGRGVGLDVVKTSIEALGGTVTVRSELGKGSCFEILIRANPR